MSNAESFDRAASLEHALGGSAPVMHGSKDVLRHQFFHATGRHHQDESRSVKLDRVDGTGRAHEGEKRGGGGKGNWGTAEDQDLDGEVLRAEEVDLDNGPDRFGPSDLVTNNKVMTLAEYEQQQRQKQVSNGK